MFLFALWACHLSTATHTVNSTRSFDACFAGSPSCYSINFTIIFFDSWCLFWCLSSLLCVIQTLALWFAKPSWWIFDDLKIEFCHHSHRWVRVVKGRAIKIVFHVTHMSTSNAVNARKKNWLTKSPRRIHMPPLPHHQTVPCHFTFNANDWLTLFACRHVKQKPDSYVSTYFKFFPAINRNFFFPSLLLVYLKISRQFCLLFYMLNENEIITSFFCVWLMEVLMSSLSFFTHKRWA